MKFNAAQVATRIADNVRAVDSGAIDWAEFSARQRAAWGEADKGELCVIGSAASRRVQAVHAALKQLDAEAA